MAATVNLSSFPFSQQSNCPHCHKPVTVFDPSGSGFVVCRSCHSYCWFNATGALQLQQSVSHIKFKPIFDLGAQGTLRGIAYKLLAYLEKKDELGFEWREYMLYNFKKGYAFLAEYEGHWSLIAGGQHYPEVATVTEANEMANLNGADYLFYNTYTPHIAALIGEFDWDIYNEHVLTNEYINPPFILVKEADKFKGKFVAWYLGEYLEPAEIAEGFNLDIHALPERVDVGANQPNPYKKRWYGALKISAAAVLIMTLIQLVSVALRPAQLILNKPVDLTLTPSARAIAGFDSLTGTIYATRAYYVGHAVNAAYFAAAAKSNFIDVKLDTNAVKAKANSTYTLDSTKADSALKTDSKNPNASINAQDYNLSGTTSNKSFEYQSLRTSAFAIFKGPAPVKIEISAPVNNNWLEADLELVSEKDNQTWYVSKEIEYYYSFDPQDRWSEGSRSASARFTDIPAGNYHLNIYPLSGSATIDHIDVKISTNVISWQNLILTVLLLCIYPFFCWFKQKQFEMNRWEGNIYSPFIKIKR